MTNVGMTGGRDYQDWSVVEAVIQAIKNDHPVLHVGDASGLDTLARACAQLNGIHVEVYRADWAKYGRAAGPIRNRLIVDNIDILYAFPGGRGTTNCIETATRLGIPVWKVT